MAPVNPEKLVSAAKTWLTTNYNEFPSTPVIQNQWQIDVALGAHSGVIFHCCSKSIRAATTCIPSWLPQQSKVQGRKALAYPLVLAVQISGCAMAK
jgi:hypothetical protein